MILTVLNIVYSLAALYLLFTRENDLSVGPPKLAIINSSILKGRSISFTILFKELSRLILLLIKDKELTLYIVDTIILSSLPTS